MRTFAAYAVALVVSVVVSVGILEELRYVFRHLRQRRLRHGDLIAVQTHAVVDLLPMGIGRRIVVTGMAAPTFLALDRGPRDRFRNGEQSLQVGRLVPTRV